MSRRWIILLRGVNVGGHGKLQMATFRTALERDGFNDVVIYIQSGNAVVTTDLTRIEITKTVRSILEDDFGFSRPVLALTATELETAIVDNPFPTALDDPKTLHLIFTRGTVALDADGLNAHCTNGEAFVLKDAVLYLHTPNGFGRSKVADKLERYLSCDAWTARNLNSCQKISALARA